MRDTQVNRVFDSEKLGVLAWTVLQFGWVDQAVWPQNFQQYKDATKLDRPTHIHWLDGRRVHRTGGVFCNYKKNSERKIQEQQIVGLVINF